MAYLAIWLLLAGFWLLLSGIYTPLLLGLGVASVSLVVWLLWRVDQHDPQRPRLRITLGLVKYAFWLLQQLVAANIEVARRILDPKLPIKPGWEPLQVDLESPLQRTLYANSITLTPDTFTTHIEADGSLMVHTLWPTSIEGLREGEMQRRIKETNI